jgi:hypothetical protein
MRKFLESLGFSINENFHDLMGLMQAAQNNRLQAGMTVSHEVTRSTALAVIMYRSPQVKETLRSFGFRYEDYLVSIGLTFPIDYSPASEIDFHKSFQEALTRYAETDDAIREASDKVLAIAILEDTLANLRDGNKKYELEGRLQSFGVDIERLSEALRSRTLPFDGRTGKLDEMEPESPTARTHSTAPFYSDHPARRDALNRKTVADTIATIIDNVWKEDVKEDSVDRAFMVHLHGRWGSGKTSILNFLKDALLAQGAEDRTRKGTGSGKVAAPRWVIVEYNAWRNQSLGPAWWTLMEAVYRQARDQLGGWRKPKGLSFIMRDRWWRIRCSYAPYALAAGLALVLGLFLVWLWRGALIEPTKSWFAEGVKIVGSILGLIAAAFAFGHTYQIGSARTAKSYVELSRDPLSPLTKRYGELIADIERPVAVFIDDLDRCNAEFVVELLQTIQTLFRHAKVLYVAAADRDWVCASYQQQYKNFSDTLGEPGKSLGHLFLEKVFQLSVEVPRLAWDERDVYWDGLINSRLPAKAEETKEAVETIASEFEQAKTEAQVIEIVDRYRKDPLRAIAAAKGFHRMHSADLVKEREHFLTRYAQLIEPNPRAMKRLLNAYGFRRGFDIQSPRRSDPDALVRWTILENRWPILADHLAGRSSGRDETDIVNALMKNPDVLKVAKGLTWEKLRPVASAPDEPPEKEITPRVEKKA